MATIDPVAFGENLRPSTVKTMKKVNEVVDAINNLDPASVSALKTDVATLKTNVSTLQSQMVSANSNIANNTNDIERNNTDIANIKTTLFTPLKADE